MEPQPNINSETIVPEPSQPQSKPWLVIILSLFCFAALLASAYFYVQARQLRKLALVTTPSPVQTQPTPTIFLEKTYENLDKTFSFMYPSNFKYLTLDNGVVLFFDNDRDYQACKYDLDNHVKKTDLCFPSTFNFNGFNQYSVQEYTKQQAEDSPIDPNTFTDQSGRVWQTDLLLGEVYNFDASTTQANTVYTVGFQSIEPKRDFFNQILSTVKFTDKPNVSPTIVQSNAKTLPYKLPQGWSTQVDDTNTFSFGYDPQTMSFTKEGGYYWLTQKHDDPNATRSYGYIGIKDYDGASRHSFILDGKTLTSQDKFPDYKEQEYIIDGMKCLFLNGISISQTPVVQGMCPLSSTQAISIMLYDRDIEAFIQTIQKM